MQDNPHKRHGSTQKNKNSQLEYYHMMSLILILNHADCKTDFSLNIWRRIVKCCLQFWGINLTTGPVIGDVLSWADEKFLSNSAVKSTPVHCSRNWTDNFVADRL